MRSTTQRRTATKVRGGKVQRKNRRRPTAHQGWKVTRESPGHGYRHVVTKQDIHDFVELVPDWPTYSERLESIVLASYDDTCDGACGYYPRQETSAIHLNAWMQDLWVDWYVDYFKEHQFIVERLGVATEACGDIVTCRFTEEQARAFMLLHVFLHELGHHFDRAHQKHWGTTKGEVYAENFANRLFELIYSDYVQTFGDPSTK